jgi:hypothetical protein
MPANRKPSRRANGARAWSKLPSAARKEQLTSVVRLGRR